MQKYRCKKTPPLSMGDRNRIHQSRVLKTRVGMRLNPKKYADEQNPTHGGPIKQRALGGNFMPPGPVTVFDTVLFENGERRLVIGRRKDQSPTRVLGEIDGGFDSLTDQNKAPIHGLSPGASRDSVSHDFDHAGKNHPFWGHSQPQSQRW